MMNAAAYKSNIERISCMSHYEILRTQLSDCFSAAFIEKIIALDNARIRCNQQYASTRHHYGYDHNRIVDDLRSNHFREFLAFKTLFFEDSTDQGYIESYHALYLPYADKETILSRINGPVLRQARVMLYETIIYSTQRACKGKIYTKGAEALRACAGARFAAAA